MIAVMVFFAPRAARWAVPPAGAALRLAMGLIALAFVLAAEAGFSRRTRVWRASPSMSFFAAVPLFSHAIARDKKQ